MAVTSREQSLTSHQGLSALNLPSLPETLSPDPVWPHTDVCENDIDLLPIILDATFGHLPEATQLMQNCNKKKKRREKTRKRK